MGLRYVFHPSRSRRTSPDRAEGRVSDMQWKGEVFRISMAMQVLKLA